MAWNDHFKTLGSRPREMQLNIIWAEIMKRFSRIQLDSRDSETACNYPGLKPGFISGSSPCKRGITKGAKFYIAADIVSIYRG